MKKVQYLGLLALIVTFLNIQTVDASVITYPSVGGLTTFQDTNTGLDFPARPVKGTVERLYIFPPSVFHPPEAAAAGGGAPMPYKAVSYGETEANSLMGLIGRNGSCPSHRAKASNTRGLSPAIGSIWYFPMWKARPAGSTPDRENGLDLHILPVFLFD